MRTKTMISTAMPIMRSSPSCGVRVQGRIQLVGGERCFQVTQKLVTPGGQPLVQLAARHDAVAHSVVVTARVGVDVAALSPAWPIAERQVSLPLSSQGVR